MIEIHTTNHTQIQSRFFRKKKQQNKQPKKFRGFRGTVETPKFGHEPARMLFATGLKSEKP
jgi:hypothetical protein